MLTRFLRSLLYGPDPKGASLVMAMDARGIPGLSMYSCTSTAGRRLLVTGRCSTDVEIIALFVYYFFRLLPKEARVSYLMNLCRKNGKPCGCHHYLIYYRWDCVFLLHVKVGCRKRFYDI